MYIFIRVVYPAPDNWLLLLESPPEKTTLKQKFEKNK